MSASELNIVSANVNGLGDLKKRTEFLIHIEKYHPDIICLVDTRFGKYQEEILNNELNYICHFNNFSSNSRGIAVLINKKVPIKTELLYKDIEGNVLILRCNYDSRIFLLTVLYGPNEDSPDFFQHLFERIEEYDIPESLIVGDFNVTLNHNMDNLNYVQARNIQARQKLNEILNMYSYLDMQRERLGDKRIYTWTNRSGPQKARLDYYLASTAITSFVTKVDILTAYKSDHCPIALTLDYTKFKRGKGFWKHNDTLLRDINYIKRIKTTIATTLAKYVDMEGYQDFFVEASNQELNNFMDKNADEKNKCKYKIDAGLLMEMVINDIRNSSISYSIAKKREEEQEENDLFVRLKWLQWLSNLENPPLNINERIKVCEEEYNRFIENKAQMKSCINLTEYKKYGEKPNAYFCSLEKNFSAQKYIPNLEIVEGESIVTIDNQKEVEENIRRFYEELYSNKDDYLTTSSIDNFLENENTLHKKLSYQQRMDLEVDISLDEIATALKSSKSSSSPGTTGISYGFYKVFWADLKYTIMNCLQYSFTAGALPNFLSRGVITLIPKGDKPKNKIENWRPLTLLNCLYKLLSKAISNRINNILPSIIHPDQCGFVKGRYIGECIRTTMDIMDWARTKDRSGLLLLIDFKKAFDSISFQYMEKVLKFFGFGDKIVNWVKILLKNFKGCINHAGNISSYFDILRGCRQGDPIASLLFILSIEVLCIKLRSTERVRGYKILEIETLLSLYADDCTIFLEYCEDSLRSAIGILESFYRLSGLQIHLKKTQCVKFGKNPLELDNLCQELNLEWKQEFKLLGVAFNANTLDYSKNIELKLNEIDKLIQSWKYRFLTPIGRACIAKTLLLSKINHLAFVLPNLSKKIIKLIEDKVYKFIWKGMDKVARMDAKEKWSKGGLKLPDISMSWQSFKFSWLRRAMYSEGKWVKILLLNLKSYVEIDSIMDFFTSLDLQQYKNVVRFINNPFWKDCIATIEPFMLDFVTKCPEEYMLSLIWGSRVVLARNKVLKRVNFPTLSAVVKYPLDIMKTEINGEIEFRTNQEITDQYGHIPETEIVSLRQIVRENMRRYGLDIATVKYTLPFCPSLVNLLNYSKKGCSKWTNMRLYKHGARSGIHKRELKWEEKLGRPQGVSFWDKCYKNTSIIFFDNKLKWFQYQIVRHCLKTNNVVSNFVPDVRPSCTFCNSEVEDIKHLFWECVIVKSFIAEVLIYILNTNPIYHLEHTMRTFIFCSNGKDILLPHNMAALYMKYYIWKTRCCCSTLSLNGFINMFNFEIRLLKLAFASFSCVSMLVEI